MRICWPVGQGFPNAGKHARSTVSARAAARKPAPAVKPTTAARPKAKAPDLVIVPPVESPLGAILSSTPTELKPGSADGTMETPKVRNAAPWRKPAESTSFGEIHA